jgi:ABC-2 type transport system ATP-binding protein
MSLLESQQAIKDGNENRIVLQLKNVSKTFKNDVFKKNRSALDGLSVSFEKGKCTGFLGHNGAGKTTAIRIILGILFPDRGDILFDNKPLTSTAKLRIGYMPEINKLPSTMTPKEILESHMRLYCHDKSRKERAHLIAEKLKQVKLSEHQFKKISQLSKGMSRRVAWAQASIHSPSLLILDEPFSGLDPLGRLEMQSWIEAEKSRGASIVLCTHELWTVNALCDSIYILRSGQLAYSSNDPKTFADTKDTIQQYLLHISGTTEDVLLDLKHQHKLPSWLGLEQEGWSSKLTFREYTDAANWLSACIKQGYLVISFTSDASRSEAYLLQYFAEKGSVQ